SPLLHYPHSFPTRRSSDLLNDSFSSLPHAFREGQRIRHGMQDILSLFLSRVLYVALLIVLILMIGEFPLVPKQVSILTLLTVGRSEEHTSELQSLRHLVCR